METDIAGKWLLSSMATDMQKAVAGAALIIVSGALVLSGAGFGPDVPAVLVSVGALGLAAGSLLLGTSQDVRPV
jgi:hypothetical protein